MPDKPPSTADGKLDESLEETFPASDAPGNTVETGVRPILPPLTPPVTGKRRDHRDGDDEP